MLRPLPSSWPSCRTPSRSFLLNSKKWHGLVVVVVATGVTVVEVEAEVVEADEAADGEGMVAVVVADMVAVEAAGMEAAADGNRVAAVLLSSFFDPTYYHYYCPKLRR